MRMCHAKQDEGRCKGAHAGLTGVVHWQQADPRLACHLSYLSKCYMQCYMQWCMQGRERGV